MMGDGGATSPGSSTPASWRSGSRCSAVPQAHRTGGGREGKRGRLPLGEAGFFFCVVCVFFFLYLLL
ncbi:Uncharacterized protein M6B38_238810 [Iris pallida]|uniref:Uncharacterized protein n=1 Tax=Iris pallida TaxID=29817 RepID=A0AAX6DLP7_IRIPA|nr:Uncharacterized protein M6B38_238810 [Iris pallida]